MQKTFINNSAFDASKKLDDFISNILNQYTLDAHIMETKEVADAYVECGDVNLEIANI